MAYFRKKWIYKSCKSFLFENKHDTDHHNIQVTDIIKLTNTACFIDCNDGFYSIKAFLNLQVLNPKQVIPIAGQFLNIKDYYFEYYKGEFVLFITKYILFGSFSDPLNTRETINNRFKKELQSELYNEFNFDDYREDEACNSFIDHLTKSDFKYDENIQSSGSVFTSIPFEKSILENGNNIINYSNYGNSEYIENIDSSEKNLESPFIVKIMENIPAGNTTTQKLLAFCPFTEPEDELLIENNFTQLLIENNFTQSLKDQNTQIIKDQNTQSLKDQNTQIIKDQNTQIIKDQNTQIIKDQNTQIYSLPPSTDLANYNLDHPSTFNTQEGESLNDIASSFFADTQIIEPSLIISVREIMKFPVNEKSDYLEIPVLVSRIYNPYIELTKFNKNRDPNNNVVEINKNRDPNNNDVVDPTDNNVVEINNSLIDPTINDVVDPTNNFLYISNKKLSNTLHFKKRPLVLHSSPPSKRQKWTLNYNSINSRFRKVNYRLPRGVFNLKEIYYSNVIEGMTSLFEYKEDIYKYTEKSKIRYFNIKPHKVLGYPLKNDIDEYEFLREKEFDIMFDPFYDIFKNISNDS